jgi:hypothetical protein
VRRMMRALRMGPLALIVFTMLVGCDDKKEGTAGAPSSAASSSAGGPAAASASAAAASAGNTSGGSASGVASATPSASASAATSAAPAAPAKEATVTVKDPVAEPKKTVQAIPGGSVTLYLPEYPGTKWTVTTADKSFGKPKEETIPGFAGPTVPAKQFTWQTTNAALKAGQNHTIQLASTKKGEAKPDKTFALTIELR